MYQTPWAWDSARPGKADGEYIVLWHGCLGKDAASIVKNGVDTARGEPDRNFGRGFYLGSTRRQAANWARRKYDALPHNDQKDLGNHPIVLRFRVRRPDLAMLEALHFFVRGDHDNDDFWSLVSHCRASTPTQINSHKRRGLVSPVPATRHEWYDLVTGPVAAFPDQRVAIQGYDQISFHTLVSVRILNDAIDSSDPNRFRMVPVDF